MYSEKLEKLIEMALLDGELTEKEKQILFKNAEKEDIDLDEFEMVLEARLFENQKNNQPKIEKSETKSDKFGNIKKCPSCGSMVQSLQTKCIDCDYEFSGIDANNSITKLFELLSGAENERKDTEINPLKAFGSMMSKGFGLSGVGDKVNNKKKSIIRNFPIPNTKEDILEFLSLALPNAKKAGNFFTSGAFNSPANDRNKLHNEFVPIWLAKCEQIVMKAKFSMKDDKKTLDEIMQYAKELKIK